MLRSGLKRKRARIFLLFNLSPAVQIYVLCIYINIFLQKCRSLPRVTNIWKSSTDSQKVAVNPQLNTGGVLQVSWIRLEVNHLEKLIYKMSQFIVFLN